jgi:hypothetical protein
MTAGNPEQKYVTPNNKGEPLFWLEHVGDVMVRGRVLRYQGVIRIRISKKNRQYKCKISDLIKM